MITLFQITGSSSFAVRAALECAGAEYEVVDVHPRRRDDAPGFADANPLKRVPALREGDVRISETGAILLWLGDRFPDAHLAPAVGTPARADHYRWVTWCANTLHVGWGPIMAPFFYLGDDPGAAAALDAGGRRNILRAGDHLERWLADHEWLAGDRPGVCDIYAYMLVGWSNYYDDIRLGGPAVADHYRRVGALPGVARARGLDDLDERLLRVHPDLRGGRPVD
jgi:glutathione S-transferase